MSKIKTSILAFALLQISTSVLSSQTIARIIKRGGVEETATFAKEGESGYKKIERNANKEFVFDIEKDKLGHYTYVTPQGRYYTIYINAGANVILENSGDSILFKGDNIAENQYVNTYKYLGYGKNEPKQFSSDWIKSRDAEVKGLNERLDATDFSDDFKRLQKAMYKYTDMRLRLEGPVNAVAFRNETPDLAPEYYSFLKNLTFEEDEIVMVPKWWMAMEMAFEQMERDGVIPVSTKEYLDLYAQRIKNENVRSAFLLQILNNTLHKGFSNDYATYLAISEKYIKTDSDKAVLSDIKEKYAKLTEQNKPVSRGTIAPDFVANDVNGKEYRLSDYKGKVVLVDFWFTGCSPCKAEMPHLEKIARDMEDKDIQFISLSLDTGEGLIQAWKDFIAKKGDETLNLNLPGGFRSPIVKEYLIKGVPRILIVDKEGRIVDAYAKRPSDPKPKKQLEELL
ncbi:MAG: TlpA family protein disulfide reductase [Bacteroidales bacterium]